ncbi:MAG: hypothetical protein HYX63_04320 [Gammaproteobacteria bacterium]|nr:hypothetical protein [Gammaproteobacteria bacterium]
MAEVLGERNFQHLKSVQSVAANGNPVTTYWQATAQDAEGHLAAFALGNGINTHASPARK